MGPSNIGVIQGLIEISLFNDPERLRERAAAIDAWRDGKPVEKFVDGKWIRIREQTAFFFDRRYRAVAAAKRESEHAEKVVL